MKARFGALVLLAGVANAAPLSIPPHLSELAPDGFVVSFETDDERDVAVEVSRRGTFVVAGTSHGRVHRVRVHGLSPNERVDYRVKLGDIFTAVEHARSGPPDTAQSLDFVVYGDTRDGQEAEHTLAVEAATTSPAFALHTGDIVPRGDDEAAWRALFTTEQPLVGEAPLYFALGNHELIGDPEGHFARRYLPPPGDMAYFTFRVGPARFIVFDSTRLDDTQLAWAERQFQAAAVEPGHPHVFVALHHPPFSVGGHCGSFAEERVLVALFERYLPSAVFAGHEHAYERLERNGVRYFVSGGGGAPLYRESVWCSDEDKAARRAYRAEHHLLRVHVRGEAIEVEALLLGGAPIETVRFARGEPTKPRVVQKKTRALVWACGALVLVLLGVIVYRVTSRRRE